MLVHTWIMETDPGYGGGNAEMEILFCFERLLSPDTPAALLRILDTTASIKPFDIFQLFQHLCLRSRFITYLLAKLPYITHCFSYITKRFRHLLLLFYLIINTFEVEFYTSGKHTDPSQYSPFN